MPKTPNGKKRKLSSKKQKGCKPKRLKFDDKEKEKCLENEKEGAEKVEGATEVSELESDREVCSNNGDLISERDIDEILEENASKNNLTATNVKSIIHHVLTDKRVLAMVQNAIAESEDSTTAVRMEPNFEPKMTRSKTKKSGQSDPISLLTKSPIKIKRKPKKHFMELELPEDSSDDEYNPAEDEGPSDDDSESCASFTSDLASPQVAATPERVESTGEESPLVTRSLSKSQSQDQAFKVPLPLPTKENSVEDSDLIAKRTRSQHSLTDTTLHSIEASFEPPDVIPELYEAIHEDDLDTDDIEWQRWLQNLVLGQDEADDDNEDTEYNFMAEDQKEEQEEYRNDRAVRIPQKEVNELITELLNDYQENEDLHSFLTEPGLFGEKDPTDSPKFSSLQRQELSNQLQMHVQLLTQVFLTSREEPTLQSVAATCREFVNELQGFSERASSARLCMALNGSDVTTTAFSFPGLDESVRIVNDKCHPVRPVPPISPRKVAKKSPLKFPKISVKKKKLEHSRKSIFSDPPEMSRSNIQIMATSRLFKFTKLLPHFGMFPKDVVDDRRLENARIKFTEAEDNLLALGLAQFAKDWDLIKEHLLPVKSSKQLQIRCKNLSSTRAKENVVKHFRRTGEMWSFPKEIVSHVPFEFSGVRYGKGEPEKPEWLLKYEKQVQKEEQEKRARAVAVVHPQVQTQPTIPTLLVPNFTSQHKVSPLVGSPGIVCSTNSTHTSGVDTRDEEQVKPQISSSTSQVTETSSVVPEKTGEPGKSELSVLENTKTNVQPFQDTALREPPLDEGDKGCASDPPCREPNNANSLGTTSESVTLQNRADSNTPSPSREKEDTSESKDSTANPSKSFTSVKGKGSRQEKPAGGGSVRSCARTQSISFDQSATCSRKTSVTQPGSMPIYVLEPDPKGDDRAQAMAEGYLSRVKKTLRNDPNTYEEFLRNLVLSSTEGWQSVQIFAKMKEVLKDYPDLVEDFIAFLAPEEAVEMGVFMNNLEFTQARSFLRKLEIQFQKSPAHFQKIIRALSSWNKGDKSSLELYNSIIPLLKGQQHLIDEFGTFFGERNPPPFIDADFEEVELGSGSETEMDDFEEVIIPDNNEPRKGKLNPKHRRTKLRGKKAQLTKPVLRPALVKNVKQQNTSYKGISTKSKLKGSLTEAKGDSCGVSQKEENEVASEVKSSNNFASSEGTEEAQKDKREEKEEDDELHLVVRNDEEGQNEGADVVEQRPSCPLESSPSEGPFSNTTSMHSNDSFKMDSCEAKEYQQHDSPGSTNVTDYEIEEEETQDKYTESDGGDMDVDEGGSGYENAQGEDSCEDSSNLVSDDGDEDNDEGGMEESVSAKNLRLGQDGKLVLWTREDDRTILRTCQQKGATEGTFLEVSHFLENKSADEVRLRFFELMKLFEVSASDENERGLGESGCSSEEDEESGTCDSDQDLSRD